ncbi:PREDICTED: RAB6-interacting golgin isoform X1 [Hipposideros armiger]|uniref:RAB6-interacting golgin n=3 Tax=Hipposideros armiger TaxID=186990 RepID=A0A8B7RQ88_HIPAR|nr:PREDICTED: RAB6-interacting golgin isoform X1 [Hipposideros armiger]
MSACVAEISAGSLSGTTGGSLGGSRTLRRGRGGLVSKLVALIGWSAAAGEEPGCAWAVVLAVGVLRFGCSRGAGSPGRMARGWAGFSEEELRRLKQNKDPFEPKWRLPMKKSRQQLQREKALQEQSQKLGLQDGSTSLPPEQLLSAPKQSFNTQKPNFSTPSPPSSLTPTSPIGDGKPQGIESQPRELELENSHDGHKNAEVPPPKPDCKLEKKKVELQEKSRWEVLQQEQRLMEEKNKRKKALLAKAIAERSKRTQAETMKLKRIQKELQALDDMVSADIGILRNRIDQASLDYSHAQGGWRRMPLYSEHYVKNVIVSAFREPQRRKRFDRAEAEYVAAKLDLQRKTDTKEQLTEHLCTIIQENELRKARKLEELMQQLDVQADAEPAEPEGQVEGCLHHQEAEAGKQVVHVEPPNADAQCENGASAPLAPDHANQVQSTVNDLAAALTP